MPFTHDTDRIRIIRHLGLPPTSLPSVDAAIANAELLGEPLVAEIVGLLDALDTIDGAIASEMQSNQGALIQAGPLRWSEGRYSSVLLSKRYKIAQLAGLLGLDPDYTDMNFLLEKTGISTSICGQLNRS